MLRPQDHVSNPGQQQRQQRPGGGKGGQSLVIRREEGQGGKKKGDVTSETGEESEDDFGQARLRLRAARRAVVQERRKSTGTAVVDRGAGSSAKEMPAMDGYTRRACAGFVDALQQLFLTPSTAFGFFCAHRTDAPPSDPFCSKRGPRLSNLPSSMVTRSDFILTLPLLGVTLSPAEAHTVFDTVSDPALGVMTYSSLQRALKSFKFVAGPDFAATVPTERPCKAVRERKQALQRFGAGMSEVWSHPAEAFVFMDPECTDTLSRKNLLQGIRRLHISDVTADQVLQELASGGLQGVVTVRDFLRQFAPGWQPPHEAAQALRDYEWIKAQGRVDVQARYGEWCARVRGGGAGSEQASDGSPSDGGQFGTGHFKLPLNTSVRSNSPAEPVSGRRSASPRRREEEERRRREEEERERARRREPIVVPTPERVMAMAALARRSAADTAAEAAEGRGAKKRGLARMMDIFSMIEASPVPGTPSLLVASLRSPHASLSRSFEARAAHPWAQSEPSKAARWALDDDEEQIEEGAGRGGETRSVERGGWVDGAWPPERAVMRPQEERARRHMEREAERGEERVREEEQAREEERVREEEREREREARRERGREREREREVRRRGASPAAERLREASRRYEAELASSPQPSASRVRSGTPERTPLHSASRARDGTPDRSTPAKAAKEEAQPATRRSLSAQLEDEVAEPGGRGGGGGGSGGGGGEAASVPETNLNGRTASADTEDNASSALDRTGSTDSSPGDDARRLAVQRVREKRLREAARLRKQEEERRARKTMVLKEKAEMRRAEEEARKARRKHLKYPDPQEPNNNMELRLFRRASSAPKARPSSRRSNSSRASSRSGSMSPGRSRDSHLRTLSDAPCSTGGLKRASSTGKQRSVRWERSVEEREELLRRGRGGLGGSRGMSHQGYYSYGAW